MTKIILIGGFLGAGKTTLLLRAARRLAEQGKRVGIVTNDQGHDLVDTALVAQQELPVVEVAGGCFCCRFPDLLEGFRYLQRTVQPDLILAEPVGSCTDLLATVVRPLLFHHAEPFTIAPLTILLDATRSLAGFSGEIDYLYRQQLAEAEVILLSKSDLATSAQLQSAQQQLDRRMAQVPTFVASARTGDGIAAWLDHVCSQTSQATYPLAIDYRTYAQAEAQLGWLNAQGTLAAEVAFSPRNWMRHFLRMLDETLAVQQAAIAHVKMQVVGESIFPEGLISRGDFRDVPFAEAAQSLVWKVSLTQSGGSLTWDAEADLTESRCNKLAFTLNARVQTTPVVLEQTVRQLFAEMTPVPDFRYEFSHFECFSPSEPKPAYRIEMTREST